MNIGIILCLLIFNNNIVDTTISQPAPVPLSDEMITHKADSVLALMTLQEKVG